MSTHTRFCIVYLHIMSTYTRFYIVNSHIMATHTGFALCIYTYYVDTHDVLHCASTYVYYVDTYEILYSDHYSTQVQTTRYMGTVHCAIWHTFYYLEKLLGVNVCLFRSWHGFILSSAAGFWQWRHRLAINLHGILWTPDLFPLGMMRPRLASLSAGEFTPYQALATNGSGIIGELDSLTLWSIWRITSLLGSHTPISQLNLQPNFMTLMRGLRLSRHQGPSKFHRISLYG